MSLRQGVLMLIAFGLTLSNVEGSDPEPAPSGVLAKRARAKLEAARRTFEGFWKDKAWREVEVPYRWSRRWLEAQCQVSDRWEDRVAAFRQHLELMRGLEQITRKAFRDRLERVDDVNASAYYVAEAAEWLARAEAQDQRLATKR
jgi:hypothetical protein